MSQPKKPEIDIEWRTRCRRGTVKVNVSTEFQSKCMIIKGLELEVRYSRWGCTGGQTVCLSGPTKGPWYTESEKYRS